MTDTRTDCAAGSERFTSLLLERLRADERVDKPVALESVRVSSRNTVVYRVRGGDTPLFCKVERGTRPVFVEDEYAMLLKLQRRLAGAGLRALVPLAVYPDLRALVSREEAG